MKLWLKALCCGVVISSLLSMTGFCGACEGIENEVFRLHILADSDSEYDQSVKLRVRDRVLKYSEALFRSAASKEEAEELIRRNLAGIESVAQDELNALGCGCTAKAELKNMYFSTRRYDSYTLPSGMYDALRITIGSGRGHNWWCVMYPSICVSAASEQDDRARQALDSNEYDIVKNEKFTYKFKVVELFEKLRSCIGG